jgi:hypothetical protein
VQLRKAIYKSTGNNAKKSKEKRDKMEIKIKKNAYVFCGTYGNKSEFRKWLQENEGNWIKVETEHLFSNQYNAEKYRIYDSMVEAVKNDERLNFSKCGYCGTMVKKGEVCTKHADCTNYEMEIWTPENCYFLKYPNGIKQMEIEVLSIHENCKKFGTYYLENFPSLDYYRLYNCKQTINFKFDSENKLFQVQNGIGFKQVKLLPVPVKVQSDLVKFLIAGGYNEKI